MLPAQETRSWAMAVTENGPGRGVWLQQRIKNILFTPAEEWARIDTEEATVKSLYLGYACLLAAIGPIARFVGGQIFGYHTLFGVGHPALINGIASLLVGYLLNLGGVYALAMAIDLMAPSFGGARSRIQALKVAVYAWTASWLFAIFQLVPQVSGLSIIGIYSLYLLYLGIPKLMKAPQDKALVYSVMAIVVALAVWIVITLAARVLIGPGPATTSI
jgi:hypothetical protein